MYLEILHYSAVLNLGRLLFVGVTCKLNVNRKGYGMQNLMAMFPFTTRQRVL